MDKTTQDKIFARYRTSNDKHLRYWATFCLVLFLYLWQKVVMWFTQGQ